MKKTILLFLSIFVFGLGAYAQGGMSDEKVIEYIQKEYTKGTSEKQIVVNLIKRGVTTTQLQRVRKKVEKLQRDNKSSMLTDGGSSKRQRSNHNMEEKEEKVPKTGRVLKSNKYKNKDKTYQMKGQEWEKMRQDDYLVNEEGVFQQSEEDSLYYWVEQMEGTERQVFGRNIFNNENLSFEPSGNMATPSNYHLGPGDQVYIDIWGASQQSIDATISPDGTIVVEGIGPISLTGLTVAQAKSLLKDKLGSRYADCHFNLSVGETRTIQVQVLGEVNVPGTYSISGLCTAFNALYAAGGISSIGTLRDIKVYRSGRQISSIDVYDYLVNGNSRSDVRLQDNDVILVGAYDCLVNVTGKVKRPMWYEMKKDETVRQLLRYTGGFTGDAYTKMIRLTRKAGEEYSVYNIDEFRMGAFTLMDEDQIEVDSVRKHYNNMIELRGAVKHAGTYQLGGEIQTVKELLLAADGLREDAYTKNAIIHRRKDDNTLEMVGVDLNGILQGSTADVAMKNGDILFIPSKTEMLGDQTVQVIGEVVFPGIYPYAENASLRDMILQAGGMTNAASLAKVDVFRRIRDINGSMKNNVTAQTYSFSLDEDFNITSDTVFALMPYDIVIIRKSPSYQEQKNVRVLGEVNFQGDYSMLTPNYRLSDLIKACQGVTPQAYIEGAHLTRLMTKEEIDSRDRANNLAQISLYENAIKEGQEMNMDIADSLLAMKRNTANTFPVAIDLKKAIENPGSEYDITLREGDVLEIPEQTNIIKISGEVMYPVSMSYTKGKNLYWYINRAGGFSHNASRNRVYGINANGSVVRLHANSVNSIQPGMEIVVPQKAARKKMSTAEIVGITSGVTSLGAIIVSVLNSIKK